MKLKETKTSENNSKAISNQAYSKSCISLSSPHYSSFFIQTKPANVHENGPGENGSNNFINAIKNYTDTEIELSAPPTFISRSPLDPFDTRNIHEDLIEQYRLENGWPPHGIDPITHEQIGPTDSEIRFGGLLDAWLQSKNAPQQQSPGQQGTQTSQPGAPTPGTVRSVAAPLTKPSIQGPAGSLAAAACTLPSGDLDNVCLHNQYVHDTLPKTIANIKNVASPYNAAIATLYNSALTKAQAAAAPSLPGPSAKFGTTVDAIGTPGQVTFGTVTHNFTQFTIMLQQFPGGVNGQAFSFGAGPTATVMLNEASNDALLSDFAGVEQTMVHETMHIFMGITEAVNASRATGSVAADPNIDRSSYATLQTKLEAALLPYITQIHKLPVFTPDPHFPPPKDATATALSFLSEAIARAEAGVYVKQRNGQAFTAADLRTLPPFIHADSYWSITPALGGQDLVNFLKTNQANIDKDILPIIYEVGEMYLNLRP
jgi:hypothetical protein